ncbi:anti-sigma factor family protein [Geodermatophilus sp. SYSU D01186]
MAEPPASRPTADRDVLEIACREFVELVTEHLERALPQDVENAIAAHLELCEPCRTYLEQIRRTAAALRSLPDPTLPEPARRRLLEVFATLHEDTHGESP